MLRRGSQVMARTWHCYNIEQRVFSVPKSTTPGRFRQIPPHEPNADELHIVAEDAPRVPSAYYFDDTELSRGRVASSLKYFFDGTRWRFDGKCAGANERANSDVSQKACDRDKG
jgi:hypothetical protein